jgi:hypothetical protein
MFTPWGKSQTTYRIADRLHWVSTSSHGGVMIALSRAHEILSPAAIARGDKFGDFLCYEEDCACNMVLFETLRLYPAEWRTALRLPVSDAEAIDDIWKTLSRWEWEYLEARGLPVDPIRKAQGLHMAEQIHRG